MSHSHLPLLLAAGAAVGSVGAATTLPVLLQVDWTLLPDIPAQGPEHQGFQDSDGGWLDDDTVVTAFGYSEGGLPGFLNTAFSLNVTAATAAARSHAGAVSLTAAPQQPGTAKTGCSYEFPNKKCPADEPAVKCKVTADCNLPACAGGCTCHGVKVACRGGVCTSGPSATLCSSAPPPLPPPPAPYTGPWEQLPSAPVPGRQEVAATLVDNGTALVYTGGFSYAPPYSYSDVLKLSFSNGVDAAPVWSVLPCVYTFTIQDSPIENMILQHKMAVLPLEKLMICVTGRSRTRSHPWARRPSTRRSMWLAGPITTAKNSACSTTAKVETLDLENTC